MSRRNGDAALLPFADRLGREPDHVIARDAGVSRAFVVSYRKRQGIPAYEGYKFGYDGARPPVKAVRAARPASGRGPASTTPASSPADASTAAALPRRAPRHVGPTGAEPRSVYRMVVDDAGIDRDYAILATSLVQAVYSAEKACARVHPDGTLRCVERIAPLLEP